MLDTFLPAGCAGAGAGVAVSGQSLPPRFPVPTSRYPASSTKDRPGPLPGAGAGAGRVGDLF